MSLPTHHIAKKFYRWCEWGFRAILTSQILVGMQIGTDHMERRQYLLNLNVDVPYDSEISLIGVYAREKNVLVFTKAFLPGTGQAI